MLPVAKLDIKEFRGIKKCQKPLKFAKFNVLLGRNNSGKSAVLQALSLLPFPTLPLPMNLGIPGKGNYRTSLLSHLTGGVSSVIYQYAGTASLDFKVNGKEYHLSLDDKGDSKGIILADSKEGNEFKACEYLEIELKQSEKWAVLVPSDSEFLRMVESQLSNMWDRVVKSRSHYDVIQEVINPTIDERFTEVFRDEGVLKLRKETEGKPVYIKVRDLGDGIKKTLSILLFLDFCSPKLVLWDDFEIAAHPSLLRKLLLWLSKKDWQVVLATHSIDVLYELGEIKPEDARIIQIRKGEDDILSYNVLTLGDVEDFLNASNDPRFLVDLVK